MPVKSTRSRRVALSMVVLMGLAVPFGALAAPVAATAADDPAGLQIDAVDTTQVAFHDTAKWAFTVQDVGTAATAGPVRLRFAYDTGTNPPDKASLRAFDHVAVSSSSGRCMVDTVTRVTTCTLPALRPGASVTMTTTARQVWDTRTTRLTGWEFQAVRGTSDPEVPYDSRISGTTIVPTHGAFDGAAGTTGGVTVSGWAVDVERAADPMDVAVDVDGTQAALLTTTRPRADVDRALHVTGDHGFRGVVRAASGAHRVCVTAADPYWGTSGIDLGCRTVRVP
ncbi:hypothetical protein BIV03_13145 [Curtobacterium sp. MCBA15_016]|uniref:hypothetical protein n=1 Tax=Curtobacterium sp. MCBA15_016 TaxID=1898740 RepID=UPI000920D41D|nr:hypothetical protein [Curtobacterium sp. MCBA15_016]OII22659.1 hypothetical protein BIV03_13145 [Curtobacterium sp. MCBA15_016]